MDFKNGRCNQCMTGKNYTLSQSGTCITTKEAENNDSCLEYKNGKCIKCWNRDHVLTYDGDKLVCQKPDNTVKHCKTYDYSNTHYYGEKGTCVECIH